MCLSPRPVPTWSGQSLRLGTVRGPARSGGPGSGLVLQRGPRGLLGPDPLPFGAPGPVVAPRTERGQAGWEARRVGALVSEVRVGSALVDFLRTPFGIRTIEFTKDKGFFLKPDWQKEAA